MDTPSSLRHCPFVDDLIPEILQSRNWWPEDLLRLCYISSTWAHFVRKLLYLRPSLRSFRSCLLFVRTISESAYLLPLIKGIEACPMEGNRLFGAEEMRVVRMILNLDGLVSITLGGELAVGAEKFLNNMCHSQSVKAIFIDGRLLSHSLTAPPSFEWDEVIACKFSGLETLRLSHLDLDIVYPSITYELGLKELALDNVRIVRGDLIQLLQQTTSLKRLIVSGQSSSELDENVCAVLQSYTIESLHYEVQYNHPSVSLSFDRDLSSTTSLRFLHLDGLRVDPETLSKIHTCFPFLQQFSVSADVYL